jgi:hypothetical protein
VSHLAAQRAIVRMLFDERFAAEARRDPARVLAALPEPLRRQLVEVDPRAFRLDRHRHKRALEVLCEEFPHSTRELGASNLGRFFSSPEFHRCVEEGGAMALAFAQFLMPLARDRGLFAIEIAIARARRSAQVPLRLAPGEIAAAPGVIGLLAPAGALARLGGSEEPYDATPVPLLTVPLDDGITVVQIDAPTLAIVRALEAGPRRDLANEALVASLLDDEILVRG